MQSQRKEASRSSKKDAYGLAVPFCFALLAMFVVLLFSCGYDACADVPVLVSISPTSALTASGPFTLTLTGRHFHSDTILMWNGFFHDSKTVNEQQMIATIAPEDIPTPGTIQVWVSGIPGGTNLQGPCGGGLSAKLPFTVE